MVLATVNGVAPGEQLVLRGCTPDQVDLVIDGRRRRYLIDRAAGSVFVHGPGSYTELTEVPDTEGQAGDIQWNFEKFVIRPDGTVAARFRPMTAPDAPDVIAVIEETLPSLASSFSTFSTA